MIFNYTVKGESYKLITGNELITEEIKRIESFADELKEISLVAGRGDFTAFQVLLGSDEAYTVNTGKHPYLSQNPFGKVNYRVAFDFPFAYEISYEYSAEENGFHYNDMISPIDVRDYPPRAVCALFVHIPVPKNAEMGEYSGKVKIFKQELFEDEVLAGEISVNLKICSFTFPAPKNRKFYLDLWQNYTTLAQHADVPLYSDAHFEIIDNYLASMEPLGQRALTLVVSEVPWGGQSGWDTTDKGNLFKYSIIDVKKAENGIFEYNYTKMQRYIDIGAKYGINSELSIYGLVNIWGKDMGGPAKDYPEKIRVRYFDEQTGSYRYMKEPSEIDAYIKAIEEYFIKTKQIDRVRVVADEPTDIEAFKKSVNHVHELAPAFRFKAAIVEPSFIDEFGDIFDDFVPYLGCVTEKFDTLSMYIKEMPEKRYLWYVCCGPDHPNMFVRSPLEESYLIGILTSYFRLDGFLRWNYTEWPENPRVDLHFRQNWAVGDTTYVYPGYNGKPLLSLRYHALHRAIQFYELLEAYRRKKGVRAYNKLLTEIIRKKPEYKGKVYDFDGYEMPSAEALEEFYAKLLRALDS
ncbi:MAG: DUF4091 domain-containing protein [Clostridia bacterium]|nr:DUF4091 domain-containing protein [Clostridia bacterium]